MISTSTTTEMIRRTAPVKEIPSPMRGILLRSRSTCEVVVRTQAWLPILETGSRSTKAGDRYIPGDGEYMDLDASASAWWPLVALVFASCICFLISSLTWLVGPR